MVLSCDWGLWNEDFEKENEVLLFIKFRPESLQTDLYYFAYKEI